MNARAAEALYEAERQGVRQIFGQSQDIGGGRCAGSVLNAAGEYMSLRRRVVDGCPACERWKGPALEDHLVIHLNDHHRFTFSEIARKLGPDSV